MNDYLADYMLRVRSTLARISPAQIQEIVQQLHQARLQGRTIFLCGNGGSAATASHWANDLRKGTAHSDLPRLRALALTDNVPLITAWANDTAYENIFAEQLEDFVQPNDIVIAISGSGNSPNVLKAIHRARGKGAYTIGLTGFAGGQLKELVHQCIVVPSTSMEQIEDVHLILTHAISTALRKLAFQTAGQRTDQAAPLQVEANARRRAVFIDRDGVVNENRADYVKSWDEFKFLSHSLGALAKLASTDFQIVITSNQSAIGRRLVIREVVEEIHRRMAEEVAQAGGRLDKILYCPHLPAEGCECRKPRPGLFYQAEQELGLDLAESYLIGDSLDDLEAGLAVGCCALLVETGRGRESLQYLSRFNGNRPVVVKDLAQAVNWIIARERAAG